MRNAVVLGGGGSRGSYQMGVWRALRELGYEYSIVAGTSVGALNAAMMVQGEYELGVNLWQNLSTTDVVDLPELRQREDVTRKDIIHAFLERIIREGGVDTLPLEGILREYVSEERIRGSEKEFGLVTVEYPSMKPYVLTKDNIPQGRLVDYLMASAACYPAMKGKEIDGKKYIDGGYHSNLPIEIALGAGAEHIVAVDLECIGRIRPVNLQDSRIKYIRSQWDLGVFLIFDPHQAQRNMTLGYYDCMKAFGNYDGKVYTFYKAEHLNLAEYVDGCLHIAAAGSEAGYPFLNKLVKTCGARLPSMKRVQKRTYGQMMLACAEHGGKLLGVDPEVIYTSQSFCEAFAKVALQLPDNPGDVERAIRSIRSVQEAKIVLGSIDVNTVPKVFCNMLRRALYDTQGRRLLEIIATFLPEEMAAGLALVALER